MPRDTQLKKTLFACDELSGFVHACGLVRPTGLDGLEPKSVKKKLKQPSFAAGVHRDEVYAGAELLGLELDEHIANVVAAHAADRGRARPADGSRRRLRSSGSTKARTRLQASSDVGRELLVLAVEEAVRRAVVDHDLVLDAGRRRAPRRTRASPRPGCPGSSPPWRARIGAAISAARCVGPVSRRCPAGRP